MREIGTSSTDLCRADTEDARDGDGLDFVSERLTWSSEGAKSESDGGARALPRHSFPGQAR